jgi:hypothetical protein
LKLSEKRDKIFSGDQHRQLGAGVQPLSFPDTDSVSEALAGSPKRCYHEVSLDACVAVLYSMWHVKTNISFEKWFNVARKVSSLILF